MVVCGYICGLCDEEEIADFAEERQGFFLKYMEYERVPCAATFRAIINTLNPYELELCLHGIFRNVLGGVKTQDDKQICIDGKTIRGANSIHIVHALLADFKLSLGQLVVDKKTNEIPAVRELLDLINIEGSIVSLDAMHCQRDTVDKIIEKKGNYVVQVKKNQKGLHEDIKGLFDLSKITETHQTIDKNHGRLEIRSCFVLPNELVDEEYFSEWRGLKKIFKVERKTEKNGKVSEEVGYYISSCANASAEELLSYTRKHWQIESFHWILDKIMGEDNSLVRDKNAQLCLSIIRKFAISIVNIFIEKTKPKKKSISGNMRKCLLNPAYLESVLAFCRS
jgi:predicted transposase YbfD/YdcC